MYPPPGVKAFAIFKQRTGSPPVVSNGGEPVSGARSNFGLFAAKVAGLGAEPMLSAHSNVSMFTILTAHGPSLGLKRWSSFSTLSHTMADHITSSRSVLSFLNSGLFCTAICRFSLRIGSFAANLEEAMSSGMYRSSRDVQPHKNTCQFGGFVHRLEQPTRGPKGRHNVAFYICYVFEECCQL